MWRKKRGKGKKGKKWMTHFLKFDNKRDGEEAGRRKLPLNFFSSPLYSSPHSPTLFFRPTTDRCHLKLQQCVFFNSRREGRGAGRGGAPVQNLQGFGGRRRKVWLVFRSGCGRGLWVFCLFVCFVVFWRGVKDLQWWRLQRLTALEVDPEPAWAIMSPYGSEGTY